MHGSQQGLTDRFSALHERVVLRHPVLVLAASALLVGFFGWHAKDFNLDATADSLTLENDADISYYRLVRARYGSDDFLIVTFSPEEDLFSEPVLQILAELRADLGALDNVRNVVSILDVPLISSPPADLRTIAQDLRSLEDSDTDSELARRELTQSALYRDLVVSADGRTTALQINFKLDQHYIDLRTERNRLREKQYDSSLTDEEQQALAQPRPDAGNCQRSTQLVELVEPSTVGGSADEGLGIET